MAIPGGRRAARMRLTGLHDDHIAAASALLERCYRFLAVQEHYTSEQLDELIVQRGSPDALRAQRLQYRFVLAWEHDELVGLVAVQQAEIAKLYVEPAHHRRGIGARLWRTASSMVREGGHRELWLGTTGYGIPLYQAMGMQITGTLEVRTGPLAGRTVTRLEHRIDSARGRGS